MEAPADTIEGKRFAREKEIPCPLCGAWHASHAIPVLFGMTAMVAECPPCRLAYQSPRPSREASLAYMEWRWRSADDYVANRAAQAERATRQLAWVKEHAPGTRKLADFAAGAGAFVRAALDGGVDAAGIEQSAAARGRAREFYNVELSPGLTGAGYDTITLWDVVEHLRDPVATLASLAERLAAGGMILIETGNFENWRRIAAGDRWGLYLFDHQFYFSPASLRRVLEEAGFCGFQLLDTNREPQPQPAGEATEWANALQEWPTHGNINVMVAAARKAEK